MLSKAKDTIRVLLLAANPSDTAALRLAEEARDIQDVLDRAEVSFEVRHITAVRPRDIPRKLRKFQPDFVHFCGHGEDKGIILENAVGRSNPVSKDALGSLFSLLRGVKCVFLNSCHSSSQAEGIARHIPYVIAMKEAISDDAAIEFAFGFYQAVGDGINIPSAFEYGKTAIGLAGGLNEADVPVLFRREPKRARARRPNLENPAVASGTTLLLREDIEDQEPLSLQPIGRRPEPADYSFPSAIWNALKLKTSYVPKNISLKSPKPIQRSSQTIHSEPFQVFEVLFTEILSLIQPSFKWEVTPIQGDQGIDFRGLKELFSVPELQISAHLVVCGQCKIRTGKSRPLEVLSSDLEKLLYGMRSSKRKGNDQTYPSYVILALASVATSRSLENAARVFMDNHHVPLYLFGLREIDYLIRQNLPALSPTISQCLPSDIASTFISYFSEAGERAPLDIEVSLISRPLRVLAGESFVINLSIAHFLLPAKRFWVRLESSSGESLHSAGPLSETQVLVVSPLATVATHGMAVGGNGHFTYTLPLRLVTYAIGEVNLGLLTVESEEGQLSRIPLGTVDVADTYTPPFYWQPYIDFWGLFNDWFAQAAAGAGKLIACLGSGGAGKTRLCQEFCIRSEQLGGISVSVAHYNGLAQPYRILRDLLYALSPVGLSNELQSPANVIQSVHQLSPALYSETQGSLAACLEITKAGESPSLNTHEIARILAALLIARASSAVTVIHLSNLHWCHPEILRLLRSIALEANNHLRALGNACIFIFEGRVGHAQATVRAGDDVEVWSTISFETFAASSCEYCIRLKPLSDADSEGFIRNIIEHSQSAHRRVSLTLIPHQNELSRRVLASARGNPQHIVEQLNLLRHKGIIGRNERTGLLYLIQPSESYSPPADVLELIESRFSYYRLHHPPLASLIRATALVDDRVDQQLFDLLKAHFAPDQNLRQIEESEFLILPDRPGSGVCFRHENYFHAIAREGMRSDDRREAVNLYVRYVDSLPRKTATSLLLRSRAMLTDPDRSWDEARQGLIVAQSLATKAREEHVELRVLEALEPLSAAGTAVPLHLFSLRRRLSELRMAIGDRRRSAESLRAALQELESSLQPSPAMAGRSLGGTQKVLDALLDGRVLLANIKLNLLDTDEPVAILELCLRTLAGGRRSLASRKREDICRAKILNRLAVAYAIAGRYAEAIDTAELSVSVARETGDQLVLYSCLVDYGNIVAPTAIDTGLAALEEALGQAGLTRMHPQKLLIGKIHLLMLRLVRTLHQETGDSVEKSTKFRCILEELAKIYTEARSRGLVQEASAAALLCGDTAILLGDSSVVAWFLEALEWAFRGNHLENLWRAHLNLAQFLLEGTEKSIESSLHHAEHALRLLGSQKSKRTEFALAQVARIFSALQDKRGRDLLHAIPSLKDSAIESSERGILEYFRFGLGAYFLY